MDDKDHVFARFKEDKPAGTARREVLTIPRRAGAPGSRVVEVVHVRSGGAVKEKPRRTDGQLRAASWEGGFPARPAIVPAAPPVELLMPAPRPAEPATHVMPAWEPAAPEPDRPEPAPVAKPAVTRAAVEPKPRRRVVDPFDAEDDGANCMRCGYAVEPAREKRGLLTCAHCG